MLGVRSEEEIAELENAAVELMEIGDPRGAAIIDTIEWLKGDVEESPLDLH